MTKIYLVRHGQTDWNKELVFRGRKDIPLNEVGNMEAQSIAHVLKRKDRCNLHQSTQTRHSDCMADLADFRNQH